MDSAQQENLEETQNNSHAEPLKPKRHQVSPDVRRLVLEHHEKEEPVEKIAKTLLLPPSTVRTIIKHFDLTGEVECKKRKGRKRILDENDLGFLREKVQENYLLSCKELSNQEYVSKGKLVSRDTIRKAMKRDLRYSVKILRLQPVSRNPEHTIQRRFDFAQHFMEALYDPAEVRTSLFPSKFDFFYLFKKVLFMDESGFNFHISRPQAWSPIGSRAVQRVRDARGPNISLIFAVGMKGIFYYRLLQHSTKAIDIREFLQSCITRLDNGRHYVLFTDNAAIHKSSFATLGLADVNVEVKFLPPYSPFLNPCEECFSFLKHHISGTVIVNEQQLINKIHDACELLDTKKDLLRNYFVHFQHMLLRCIQKEVIEEDDFDPGRYELLEMEPE